MLDIPKGASKEYGHVGIVQSVNPDGSIMMKSSNRTSSKDKSKQELASTVRIEANDPRIAGYVIPDVKAGATTEATTEYAPIITEFKNMVLPTSMAEGGKE